jgi:hypothetical protein
MPAAHFSFEVMRMTLDELIDATLQEHRPVQRRRWSAQAIEALRQIDIARASHGARRSIRVGD